MMIIRWPFSLVPSEGGERGNEFADPCYTLCFPTMRVWGRGEEAEYLFILVVEDDADDDGNYLC